MHTWMMLYDSAKASFPRFLLQYVLRIRSAILTKVNPYIYCHGGLHMISMAINAPLMANTIEIYRRHHILLCLFWGW